MLLVEKSPDAEEPILIHLVNTKIQSNNKPECPVWDAARRVYAKRQTAEHNNILLAQAK